MREIKFRAWDFDKKTMVIVMDIHYTMSGKLKHVSTVVNCIKNYELMQYTGLKDKNGKEIYEGDIVKLYNGTYALGNEVVKWVETGFNVPRLHGITIPFIPNYEVIGNIYENPELLEGSQSLGE